MFSANGDVGFISAHHDLLAGPYDLPVLDSGVEDRLLAAPADRRDFLQAVRKLEETLRSLKQMAGEVGPQSVADNGNVQLVDDPGKCVYLLRGEKLRLVNDQAVDLPVVVRLSCKPLLLCLFLVRVDGDSEGGWNWVRMGKIYGNEEEKGN